MPASMLIYGSILIDVTLIPQFFSIVPKELAMTPFPMPLITPPVTKIYFILEILLARAHISRGIKTDCVWNTKHENATVSEQRTIRTTEKNNLLSFFTISFYLIRLFANINPFPPKNMAANLQKKQ